MDTYNLPNAQFIYVPDIYIWIEESVYNAGKTVYNIIVYYNGVCIDEFKNVPNNTVSLTFKNTTYLRGHLEESLVKDLKYYEKWSIKQNNKE